MHLWQVAAGANGLVAVAYLGISAAVFVPLVEARQLRSNRLGLATGLIFLSCAVGHGEHALHLLLPAVGVVQRAGSAARLSVDWHVVAVDVVTAAVGAWYWTLRRSYGRLLESPALFEDLDERRRQAAEVNDTVVQGIVTAQLARRLGRHEQADAALDATLVAARDLVSRLLAEASPGRPQDAGDFVRSAPADVLPAPRPHADRSPEHR